MERIVGSHTGPSVDIKATYRDDTSHASQQFVARNLPGI